MAASVKYLHYQIAHQSDILDRCRDFAILLNWSEHVIHTLDAYLRVLPG
jgi:hypothetical protein